MHKYFARRPWNVFNELIERYSSPGDIVLDPFCGGGVTVVESLKLKRKAVGMDVNPLATYVTEMECKQVDLGRFRDAISLLEAEVGQEISSLYQTTCRNCSARAIADWIEWDERTRTISRVKYDCPNCGPKEGSARKEDARLAAKIAEGFDDIVKSGKLWFPRTRIPSGDKTDSLLSRGISSFKELFTPRNLLALSELLGEIERVSDDEVREFLRLAFSSCLKWASRQSHLRGKIVEGWAMHAYWIYPKSLEINVWNTFQRRVAAVLRGKGYSNEHLGDYVKIARDSDDLANSAATCLLLTGSSSSIPLPNDSVDAIITDPPYGGNVNYAELSDYWYTWLSRGRTIEKKEEIIINRAQRKGRQEYEALLASVLLECYRVLKPDRYLVSTFNSKDVRIVACFVTAASKAGFTLLPDGFVYQDPVRPYATTFHAMQIGAFVGDFIFTFRKNMQSTPGVEKKVQLNGLKEALRELIVESVKGQITEPQLREKSYNLLIPFLSTNARTDPLACRDATNFFEAEIREHELHFRQLRKRIVRNRKRTFRTRR
jgi:hypothetical protein